MRLQAPRSLRFQCTCSREKSSRTLKLLGPEELGDILREEGSIDVTCEFCGARYFYDEVQLAALAQGAEPDAPDVVH